MSTTNLEELKNHGHFTWGKIIKIEEIGPYAIASFNPWKTDGCTILTGQPNYDKTEYHTWVDGKSCAEGFESFDAALAGCIAYKAEGPNHRADQYFIKSIQPDQSRLEMSDERADEIVLKYWNEHGKGETDSKAYKALVQTIKNEFKR